ncbi:hypothetical protein [Nocardia sp. NPDC046763]|uniref:hypothetical protein n=1 Tax=Nocardia sp. NPDC046763 TaxID=3155256 RepID=UPI0033F1133D
MKYHYVGEPERVYPELGIEPEFGETYELDRDPGDGRWMAVIPGLDTVAEALGEPAAAADVPACEDQADEDDPEPDDETDPAVDDHDEEQ